jgi:hypothetical protein
MAAPQDGEDGVKAKPARKRKAGAEVVDEQAAAAERVGSEAAAVKPHAEGTDAPPSSEPSAPEDQDT